METAIKHCTAGLGIWEWASNDKGGEPDVVMACCGDVPTLETLAAVALLLERGEAPQDLLDHVGLHVGEQQGFFRRLGQHIAFVEGDVAQLHQFGLGYALDAFAIAHPKTHAQAQLIFTHGTGGGATITIGTGPSSENVYFLVAGDGV